MKKDLTDEELKELLGEFRRKQKKKGMETSKKILVMSTITYYVMIFIGVYLAVVHADSTVLKIMAGGVVSTHATAIGFYYWKARAENLLKLKAVYKEDFVALEEARNTYYYDSTRNPEVGDFGGYDVPRDISNGI